jgi:hypothetical protein
LRGISSPFLVICTVTKAQTGRNWLPSAGQLAPATGEKLGKGHAVVLWYHVPENFGDISDRALVELQVGLKVLPVGVAEAGAWNYAFTYELLARWFPEIPEQAREIGRGEARRALVQRYLDNVVAADQAMVAKVFHVLRWTPTELNRTVAKLLEEGMIQEVRIKGTKKPQLVSNRALCGNPADRA